MSPACVGTPYDASMTPSQRGLPANQVKPHLGRVHAPRIPELARRPAHSGRWRCRLAPDCKSRRRMGSAASAIWDLTRYPIAGQADAAGKWRQAADRRARSQPWRGMPVRAPKANPFGERMARQEAAEKSRRTPSRGKLKEQGISRGTGEASCRAREAAGMDQSHGREDMHLLRRAGRRRQGRRDQGDHRKGQPAGLSSHGLGRSDRAREIPDVHAALLAAFAGGRRNRDLRSKLVQSRGRRTRPGLLHARSRSRNFSRSRRWSRKRSSNPA